MNHFLYGSLFGKSLKNYSVEGTNRTCAIGAMMTMNENINTKQSSCQLPSKLVLKNKYELHKKSSDVLVSFENLSYFYTYISNKHT